MTTVLSSLDEEELADDEPLLERPPSLSDAIERNPLFVGAEPLDKVESLTLQTRAIRLSFCHDGESAHFI